MKCQKLNSAASLKNKKQRLANNNIVAIIIFNPPSVSQSQSVTAPIY